MIIKFINGVNNNRSDFKGKIEYIRDPQKTNEKLIGSICCSKKYPYNDMLSTKRLFRQINGKQYEHYVIGFSPRDKIDCDNALRVIRDISGYFKGHQSIFALHTNTDNLHAHVVMNNINCNGKRFRQWKPQLEDFKSYVNTVCLKYNIEPIRGTLLRRPTDDETEYEFTSEELKTFYFGGRIMNKNTMPNARLVETFVDSNNCDTPAYYNSILPMMPMVCPPQIPNCYNSCNYPSVPAADSSYVAEPVVTYPTELVNLNINVGDTVNVVANSKQECIELLHAVAEESRNNAVNLDIKELLAACAELGTPVNVNIGTVYNAGVYSNR